MLKKKSPPIYTISTQGYCTVELLSPTGINYCTLKWLNRQFNCVQLSSP